MTAFEVWKYLTRIGDESKDEEKITLADVMRELEGDKLKRFVCVFQGFYFLRGREYLVGQRIERNKIAEKKLKIAIKIAKFLRFVPFVRMIAVSGRLAMKNTEKKSDLDFLIALKNRKIFTGRLLVTLAVHLLGKRRYGVKIEDRACLNHFFNNKYPEINLKDNLTNSEYFFSASEYHFLFPIFGPKTFQKFKEKNVWIKKYKINYATFESSNLKFVRDILPSKIIRKAGEWLLRPNFIEKLLKKWQMERIAKDPRTHQRGSVIIANDKMLVFLPEPQGVKIYEKFIKKLNDLSLLG
jgi:predicted nucleotidyltransferase